MNEMVTITLTKEQAEKLSAVLWDAQDEGPRGDGWASDTLIELSEGFGGAGYGER